MNSYQILLDILDCLRDEAPESFKSYHPEPSQVDLLNAARSKAYIHLLLKVRFGLLEFAERETRITEGGDDGGIDAFHIDPDRKVIYFIQSKFRTNEKNFQEKSIDPEELLKMDVGRILDGETTSEAGQIYNSKIINMIKLITDTRHWTILVFCRRVGQCQGCYTAKTQPSYWWLPYGAN